METLIFPLLFNRNLAATSPLLMTYSTFIVNFWRERTKHKFWDPVHKLSQIMAYLMSPVSTLNSEVGNSRTSGATTFETNFWREKAKHKFWDPVHKLAQIMAYLMSLISTLNSEVGNSIHL